MARTSTVNPGAPAASTDLSTYCRDLADWPLSWMGFEKDLPPGEKIVNYFLPFLQHLVGLNLSRKTMRKHADNLWILGGEIIRDLNETQDPEVVRVLAHGLPAEVQ